MPDRITGEIDRIVERLCREYVDLPGLSLTRRQVQRFCGVDDPDCDTLLDSLLQSRFLDLTPTGSYVKCGIRPPAGPPDCHVQI